jgi:5-methylcytosine-specific restriction protein B
MSRRKASAPQTNQTTQAPLPISTLAQANIVLPSDFSDDPQKIAHIASEPLSLPDLNQIVQKVYDSGFYPREVVEEAVVAISIGHLLIGGPPGTGKTKIAHELASACGAKLLTATANPEWSVYDVIGTLALKQEAGATSTVPQHGVITRAIIECANTMVRNNNTGDPPSATWLLIDEINRAEIDRAFGPLFSALSGDQGYYTLDYMQGSPDINIPERFRIIATMNDYDTRFVNSMSAALRRRFKRVLVLPPENDADGKIPQREFDVALESAKISMQRHNNSFDITIAEELQAQHGDDLRHIFGSIRQLDGQRGVPVGTAQVMDCCTYTMALVGLRGKPDNRDDYLKLIDEALAVQLVSGLESDSTRIRLGDGEYVDKIKNRFPYLERTFDRLNRFLRGEE